MNICRKEISRDKEISEDEITKDLIDEKLNECLLKNENADRCQGFVSYTYDDFKKYSGQYISDYAVKIKLKI